MKTKKLLLSTVLCCSLLLSGCIATLKLTDKIDGNYRNTDGSLGTPHPYYCLLLPFTIVFDIATSPIQAFWLGAQL